VRTTAPPASSGATTSSTTGHLKRACRLVRYTGQLLLLREERDSCTSTTPAKTGLRLFSNTTMSARYSVGTTWVKSGDSTRSSDQAGSSTPKEPWSSSGTRAG
jgi:hypothetical protein